MRLSEAIRLGAMMYPQCFGGNVNISVDCRITHTCALAGAAQAIGFEELAAAAGIRELCILLEKKFPDARKAVRYPCFCVPGTRGVVFNVVLHLNDHHRWTREKIADWVQTIEDAQPVAEAAELAAVTA